MSQPDIMDALNAEFKTFGAYRSLSERLAIIQYQIGAIARDIIHGQSTFIEGERRAYHADALLEVCDALTSLDMLRTQLLKTVSPITNNLFYSLDYCLQIGIEHQIERMEEWRQRRER